jgi:hypothetical protein
VQPGGQQAGGIGWRERRVLDRDAVAAAVRAVELRAQNGGDIGLQVGQIRSHPEAEDLLGGGVRNAGNRAGRGDRNRLVVDVERGSHGHNGQGQILRHGGGDGERQSQNAGVGCMPHL